MEHAAAWTRTHGARALVGALKTCLVGAQRTHHEHREIVLAVDAPRIAARHEEEGRRAIDDKASNVLRLRPSDTRSLLDFEP